MRVRVLVLVVTPAVVVAGFAVGLLLDAYMSRCAVVS